MGREYPSQPIALLPLCRAGNTGPFLLLSRFVAPVPPRFTNFLTSEIRAKTFDDGGNGRGKKPGTAAGLSFWSLLNWPPLSKALRREMAHMTPEARCSPHRVFRFWNIRHLPRLETRAGLQVTEAYVVKATQNPNCRISSRPHCR